jgi:hypothetical protein
VNPLTSSIVKPADDAATQQEETMWQVHAQFRLGDLRSREIDMTPAVCLFLVVGTFALMITTGL